MASPPRIAGTQQRLALQILVIGADDVARDRPD